MDVNTLAFPIAVAVQLSEFRKRMNEVKKVSKVSSITHILAPTS